MQNSELETKKFEKETNNLKKFEKETNNLKKKLLPLLQNFEKCKEWPEFSNWLANVYGLFKDNQTPFIHDKNILAKRIAQCLHPQLPHGVHLNALGVYEIVFSNLGKSSKSWAEDLAIFSIGLFPFFHYASFQVKPKIIEIYRNHYLPLGKELTPCLPGLIVSILPGLEEQNEDLQKKVLHLLDDLPSKVDPRYFIGCLWMALLRVPKVRMAALKYLSRRLKNKKALPDEGISSSQLPDMLEKSNRHSSQDQEDLEMDIESEYPNKSMLVINALIACLDDDNIMIKRAVLDYLAISVPVTSNELFAPEEMVLLVEGALSQLYKKENSVMRRVYTWLFGPPDYENKYNITEENESVMGYIIKAFRNMFKRDPKDENEAVFPLKVLQFFFDEHDYLRERLLGELAVDLVTHIHKCASGSHSSMAEGAIKHGKRLMLGVANEIHFLLRSLAKEVKEQIDPKNSRFNEEIQIIGLLEFTFEHILSLQDQKENSQLPDTKKEYIKVLLEGILGSLAGVAEGLPEICRRESREKSTPKVKFFLDSFQLAKKFFDTLNSLNKSISSRLAHEKEEVDNAFVKVIPNYLETFGEITQFFAERIGENDGVNNLDSSLDEGPENMVASKLMRDAVSFFENACLMAVHSQRYLPTDTVIEEMPIWLKNLFECTRSTDLNITNIAIDAVVSIFSYEDEHVVYRQLKNLTYNPSFVDERSFHEDDPNSLYVKIIIEKLWILLDYEDFQPKVINLLHRIYIHFTTLFAKVVSRTLSDSPVNEREKGIQRFSTFWKLTSEFKGSEQGKEFYKESFGLTQLLEFLENENPLLRHASKNWLMDSFPQFSRVLDPIFRTMLGYTQWYKTNSDQYFYANKYDTNNVTSAFRKMKSILHTAEGRFTNFVLNQNLDPSFFDEWKQVVGKSAIVSERECRYSNFIVVICLRYIQGQALESMGREFCEKNLTINASACEFLELFMLRIAEDNREVMNEICISILKPLLVTLSHTITNREDVKQIQLISLLRALIFNPKSNLFSKDSKHRERLTALFSSKSQREQAIFIPTLLRGLRTPYPYVIVQYKDLLTRCVPVISDFLKDQSKELTEIIMGIIQEYHLQIQNEKVLGAGVERSLLGESNDDEDSDEDRLGVGNWKMQSEKPERNKKEITVGGKAAINVSRSGGKQLQTKVPVCLDGIMSILQYFLKVAPGVRVDYQKGDSITTSSIFGVITFGVFNSATEETNKVQFVDHNQTCHVLLDYIDQLISIYKHCWKVGRNFREICGVTKYGIPSFLYERFSVLNKSSNKDEKKFWFSGNGLKNQILSVLQPLLAKYPEQILHSFLKVWLADSEFLSQEFPNARIPYSANDLMKIVKWANCQWNQK